MSDSEVASETEFPASRPGRRTIRRDLTEGPITSTLIMFSLPLLGGNVLQSLNFTANQFWVGHILGDHRDHRDRQRQHASCMLTLGAIFGATMAANILIAQPSAPATCAWSSGSWARRSRSSSCCRSLLALLGWTFAPHILTADAHAAGGAGGGDHLSAHRLRRRCRSCTSSCSCRWPSAARAIAARRSISWPWRWFWTSS